METFLLKNGKIVDGSGTAPFEGHVLVKADKIAAILKAGASLPPADAVINAAGANEKVNVLSVNTRTDDHDQMAWMDLTLTIHDTDQLSRLLSRISQLPNVLEVHRHVQ